MHMRAFLDFSEAICDKIHISRTIWAICMINSDSVTRDSDKSNDIWIMGHAGGEDIQILLLRFGLFLRYYTYHTPVVFFFQKFEIKKTLASSISKLKISTDHVQKSSISAGLRNNSYRSSC